MEAVIDAFVDGARSGFSDDIHIEDDMLLAERMIPFGVRLGPSSLLLREDVPSTVSTMRAAVEKHLETRSFTKLEPDARLGDIAAIQVTGIRGGVWDLWGQDPDVARQDLERAARGDDGIPLEFTDAAGQDLGTGMTLDELLDDLQRKDLG